MLKCVENCGPRHPPKIVPWARCQKIFKFTLNINFFKKPNKKNTIEPKSYTAMLLNFFLIPYCLLAQKMETEKWPEAADSPPHVSFSFFVFERKSTIFLYTKICTIKAFSFISKKFCFLRKISKKTLNFQPATVVLPLKIIGKEYEC